MTLVTTMGVQVETFFEERFENRNARVVPLPLHLGCNGECGRRLSKGQASLPLRSPCTTLAASNLRDEICAPTRKILRAHGGARKTLEMRHYC